MSSGIAQPAAIAPSSSDVLIFNNNPVGHRIFYGVVFLAMAAFGVFLVYASELVLLPIGLGGLYVGFIGYAVLTQVEELKIDFSQHLYQLRRGFLWDQTVIGSLSDLGHLSLGIGHHPGGKEGRSYDYLFLELFWRNGATDEWPPKLIKFGHSQFRLFPGDEEKGFILKSVTIQSGEESRTNAKRELMSYAGPLASRLQIPIIDKTEASQEEARSSSTTGRAGK